MTAGEHLTAGEHRARFDFEVDFTNGGGIQGQGFRLDIEGDDISDEELAAYIIRDMRLLMAGEVRILNKQIIREAHKRSRATPKEGQAGGRIRIDLSHVVENGMVTYPGLPAPAICDFLSRGQSRARYAPGTEFQIGMIELCGSTGTCLDSPFHGHPFLTAAAAEHLATEGAALAGIDSLNIDDTGSGERPVHSILLAAGIPICEHLTNLAALPAGGFRFSAVPVKIRSMGTFPVRAFATIQAGGQG